MVGVAINIDENVPEITPIIKAKDNQDKFSPPNIYIDITTNRVVREVIAVRLNVSFNDIFIVHSSLSPISKTMYETG